MKKFSIKLIQLKKIIPSVIPIIIIKYINISVVQKCLYLVQNASSCLFSGIFSFFILSNLEKIKDVDLNYLADLLNQRMLQKDLDRMS